MVDSSNGETGPTAPVSHQKRCERSAMNAIEIEQKCREFNEADRYPAAHNSLVNGWRRHVVECLNALKQLFAEGSRAPWTVHQWPYSESWLEQPFVSRGPTRKQFA